MKKITLTAQIFIALGLGVLAGLLLQKDPGIAQTFIAPLGTIFLNLIKTVVVPVVLFSIMQGILSLKDIRKVGTIGLKTLVFYMITTVVAITLGIVFANLFHVSGGYVLSPDTVQGFEPVEAPRFIDTLIGIFPSNIAAPLVEANMLQVIVIALLFGFGILLAGEKGRAFADFTDSIAQVCNKVMGMIIRLSPIGVFGLIAPVMAQNGPSVLLPLMRLILVVYGVCILHMVLVYSAAVKSLAKISPLRFFKTMLPAMAFAFSSASSVGTIPLNLQCTQRLGAGREVASFVLPLGATINMDGTAIYQGVCAIFIAQVYGIDLTLGQQLVMVLTAVLASIGTAGVPGAGVVMLTLILQSAGLPLEGIALVAGIDRILDMARTTVNITGDGACTLCVSYLEGLKAAPADSDPLPGNRRF